MSRRLAVEVLRRVESSGARAKETLEALATGREVEERDRDLANEIVHGVLRCQDAIDAVLATRVRKPLEKTDPLVRSVLRIGAYQILWLDRVPRRAAVHSSVELVREVGRGAAAGFVNAVLRGVSNLAGESLPGGGAGSDHPRRVLPRGDGTHLLLTDPVFPDPADDLPGNLAARWSHPRWLVERWLARFGHELTLTILEAGIARPPLSIRPAEAHCGQMIEALRARGTPFEEEGRCLLLRGAGKVEELPGWDLGWFSVQDATAADVVPALAPPRGASVIDLCAAPGGKAVALAEAVGPDGIVLAVDVSPERAQMVRAEIARRALTQVAVVEADATDAASLPRGLRGSPTGGFDAVLLDAPCSNTGVLARRVEVRHRLHGADVLDGLVDLQRKLLEVAGSRVRAGGRLAYSTCSLEEEENAQLVRAFLSQHAEFRLEGEMLRLPVPGRRDGGYVAVMNRA